jgi:N-acetylneuraminate epimerase
MKMLKRKQEISNIEGTNKHYLSSTLQKRCQLNPARHMKLNFRRLGIITSSLFMFGTYATSAIASMSWKQLSPIPDTVGFAGTFAGVSKDVLIVGGGANFPHKMPWEGGTKIWHDSVFVLPTPDGKWLTGFKLPRPLGYGVSVTTPKGVICAGGSNADGHYQDVFLLQWTGNDIKTKKLPSLPEPMANGCGAIVGHTFYVAGGTKTPNATNALKTFWALDLSSPKSEWQELEPWPGPGRMLAVAGAYKGVFYLFSGTSLHADAQGQPARRYLTDAYCYKPREGWKKLADLPRSAVAAPSPAIVWEGRLLVVTGDDGKLVNFEPKSQHPGFPKNILAYDPKSDRWTDLGESPISRATAPVVMWHHHAVVVNGEVHPGYRTPEVWELDMR